VPRGSVQFCEDGPTVEHLCLHHRRGRPKIDQIDVPTELRGQILLEFPALEIGKRGLSKKGEIEITLRVLTSLHRRAKLVDRNQVGHSVLNLLPDRIQGRSVETSEHGRGYPAINDSIA
jgi:hypothetical protein